MTIYAKKTNRTAHPLLCPRFIITAALLILAGTGLRPLIATLKESCQKYHIDVRVPLENFKITRLPSFRTGWEIQPAEAIEAVETNEYSLTYLKRNNPNEKPALANLFVTYYSKPGDKVPHSPDVCYRQGGEIVKSISKVMIDTPQLAPKYPRTPATLIIFEMKNNDQAVLYLFCADGKFCRSRNLTRLIISKPGNKYMYFAKIEAAVSFQRGSDPTPAVNLCKQIIGEAVPLLIHEHFPTDEQLRGD